MGSSEKSESGTEIMGNFKDCWRDVEKFTWIREKGESYI